MKPRAPAILFFGAGLLIAIPHCAQSPALPPAEASLLEQGKQVFASKCAKCHDTDASSKLPDGTTLLTRLTDSKDAKALLGTRLKSMNEKDARAVALYVEGLLDRFRASHAIPRDDR